MAPNKTTRGGISLRRRVTAWLAAILLVTMLSNGIATVVGQWAVRAFDALLADNAACYTVQDAIKDETQAFARYVRQPTSESEQVYTAACAAAEQSLAALPFDYARIGAERYARTWNLLQGYEGYRQERDAFLRLSPAADTYIERMYHVMALQDYLAEYALRLTQATLEQENTLYSSTAAHIRNRARAKTLSQFFTDLNGGAGLAHGQRLTIGVDGDKFHALQARVHHAVDRVIACTAAADYLDRSKALLILDLKFKHSASP